MDARGLEAATSEANLTGGLAGALLKPIAVNTIKMVVIDGVATVVKGVLIAGTLAVAAVKEKCTILLFLDTATCEAVERRCGGTGTAVRCWRSLINRQESCLSGAEDHSLPALSIICGG